MDNEATMQLADLPAGFWVRGGAVVIDAIVVVIACLPIRFLLGSTGLVSALARFTVSAVYYTLMIGYCGQTVGKMAAGVRVVRMDAAPISYPRSLGRHFATILSGLILCIGYLVGAFTDKKRTLHDYIADTRVVYIGEIGTARKAVMVFLSALLILSPLALGYLMATNPTVSAMFKRPGEDQSSYDKFQTLTTMSKEGQTKGNLGSLRSAIAIYYGDTEGIYPQNPSELISPNGAPPNAKMKFPYIPSIPMVQINDHAATNEVEIYGNEVCIPKDVTHPESTIDGTKIHNTGKWGYVADKNSQCWGDIFVDSTGMDYKGRPWYSF